VQFNPLMNMIAVLSVFRNKNLFYCHANLSHITANMKLVPLALDGKDATFDKYGGN